MQAMRQRARSLVHLFLAAWLLAGWPAAAQVANWSGTWGTAPAGPPPAALTRAFKDQTLRLIVHTSTGGSRVRIHLSNEMGSAPLRIGAAHIGVRDSGAVVASMTERSLTFGGAAGVTIGAGARVLSDPVSVTVAPLSDLAVSLFLPGASVATTIHPNAFQTSYVSTPGDFSAAPALPVQGTLAAWPFLTGVDLDLAAPVLVAFGDSITDGLQSSANANHRWPDYLARRLQALGAAGRVGIVNRGISANQLLTTEPTGLLAGRAGLERFERDVLSTAGVQAVVVLIGINDISYHSASAARLVDGYRQLVARAHARGVNVYGATLLPFEGSPYYTGPREAIRQSVNQAIRAGAVFDAVIDFDLALRDPARGTRLRPGWDSGDHLHPNDAGYQRMAEVVPLGLVTVVAPADAVAEAAASAAPAAAMVD